MLKPIVTTHIKSAYETWHGVRLTGIVIRDDGKKIEIPYPYLPGLAEEILRAYLTIHKELHRRCQEGRDSDARA